MDSSIVEIFTAADVNKDGQLDIDELRNTLFSFGISLSELQLKLVRDDIDVNGDGFVSFEEFRETIAEKSQVVNHILSVK
jgi:Ca2+-binding EF-hand superfamily protein